MLCRTDAVKAARYLRDAAQHYEATARSTREQDRARLMRRLARKIERVLTKNR